MEDEDGFFRYTSNHDCRSNGAAVVESPNGLLEIGNNDGVGIRNFGSEFGQKSVGIIRLWPVTTNNSNPIARKPVPRPVGVEFIDTKNENTFNKKLPE